ncbi:MAG: hypothetical protein K8T26_07795 [Lentisphaerae bacterium]|nr:hypothetical protein [Lentisphaerota bacterium]
MAMKVLHHVIGALLALVAAVGGGLTLRSAALGTGGGQIGGVTLAEGARLEAVGLGLALLMLAVLYALTGLTRRRRRRLLSFDNEGGTVSITTDAICDFVSRLAPEFPAIVRLVPEVMVSRRSIDICVGVRIKGGPQIHEVCELLQQRIREKVTTGLGISQVRRVEVSVMDIVAEAKPL